MTQTIRFRPSACLASAIALLLALAPAVLAGQAETAGQWRYVPSGEGDACELAFEQVPVRAPGAGEIQVRIRATSFNGRDRYILAGACGEASTGQPLVPLSDGAGEVVAVGEGVRRFEPGDRVVGTYFGGSWIDGDRPPGAMEHRRGVPGVGMLSEIVVDDARGFVRVPEHLSWEEAATLPIAAVTAWAGLFKHGELEPNEYVLLEGTGGVSSFGLLFATAAGARPIITSSSDQKLERARELGAVGTVNYRRNPDWHEEVLELTGGAGVKHVLEIGGERTRPKALEATGIGGHVSLIGGLTGFGGSIPVGVLFDRDISATGFHVGSRADFEAMNAFMEGHRIHPIVDRVFDFEEAPEAFDFFLNGDFMGKVVIRL